MIMAAAFRPVRRGCLLLVAVLAAGCVTMSASDPTPSAPDATRPPDESSGANDTARAPGTASDNEVRVGYGTQDPGQLTGAVASIKAEDAGREATSIIDLMEGRLPGVAVRRLGNGGVSIRVRGAASLMGGGEPLFVIDGRTIMPPAGPALMAISPRDVVRIDVLKDAGATAIYGGRGANGVILITTRRAPRETGTLTDP